jgi:hypothetical protein
MYLKSFCAVLLGCFLLATGANSQGSSQSASPPTLTAEEVSEAARLIEDAVAIDGARAVSQRMDTASFLARVFAGRDIDDEAAEILRQNWSFTELLGDFIRQIEGGGTYTFRGLVDRQGEVRARFRLVGDDLTLNYHDVLISRDRWGGFRVDDFTPLSTGTDMSTVVGMIYEAGLAVEGGSDDPVHTFINSSISGDPHAAWRDFPAAIARERSDQVMLHVLRLRSAYAIGTDEVTEAARDFLQAYPDHPTVHLNLIDAMEAAGDLVAVNVALDNLERLLDEDAFLMSIRALLLWSLNDLEAARRTARLAFDAEPDLPGAATVDFVLSVFAEDYDRAVVLLKHMEAVFEYDISPADLEADPDLAGLIASEQYRAWLASRPAAD